MRYTASWLSPLRAPSLPPGVSQWRCCQFLLKIGSMICQVGWCIQGTAKACPCKEKQEEEDEQEEEGMCTIKTMYIW